MVDCVVCRYWSERVQEARKHQRGKRAPKGEKRVIAALRAHQHVACACRFPDLLKDLVKHEPEPPNKTPRGFCDPVRVRILVASLCDEFGLVPANERQ